MKWIAAASLFLAGLIAILLSQIEAKQEKLALSTVKVMTETGHGSGVHIGDGYILTAAHVVKGSDRVNLLSSEGEEGGAEVLWANKAHDVALLKVDNTAVASSPLSCRRIGIGQNIKAIGNPGPLEYISSWGRVGSNEAERGPWRSSIILDITIAPGSSGGPVFDVRGNVVGLIVGIAMTSDGFTRSAIPYTYAVPSSTVCKLLARNSS